MEKQFATQNCMDLSSGLKYLARTSRIKPNPNQNS